MGLPWGQVVAPVLVRMRSSTSGEMTCSQECASSWARCQGISRMSTRSRSASRWRRTSGVATSRPCSVRLMSRSSTVTRSARTRRRTCSDTAGAETPNRLAMRAWGIRPPSSSISKMASRYSCAPWGTCAAMRRLSSPWPSAESARRQRGGPPRLSYYIAGMPTSSKSPAPTVLLLDGHSLAYRAFFALAEADLRTTSGQATNAVYGFTSMLIKAWQEAKSRYLAVAFDRGAPLERLAIRPEYKAQRQTPPDEFRQQVGLIREVLKVLQVPVFEMDIVEADDIIHVLGSQLAAEGATAVVVTADRDFFQMVGPRVRVVMNRRGISDTVTYDEAAVRQRYGFGPERYLDYAALRGDASDNIDGVPGIGEKTAAKLIQTYGTLEEIFEHLDELPPKNRERLGEARTRLLENREFFRFRSREELAAHGAPVEILDVSARDLQMGRWDAAEVRRLFDSLEFRTLYERLGTDLPAAAPQGGLSAEAVEVASIDELQAAAREA